MLTTVNKNKERNLAVIKHHAQIRKANGIITERVFEYQVHDLTNKLNPVLSRHATKGEADATIGNVPVNNTPKTAPDVKGAAAKIAYKDKSSKKGKK